MGTTNTEVYFAIDGNQRRGASEAVILTRLKEAEQEGREKQVLLELKRLQDQYPATYESVMRRRRRLQDASIDD